MVVVILTFYNDEVEMVKFPSEKEAMKYLTAIYENRAIKSHRILKK